MNLNTMADSKIHERLWDASFSGQDTRVRELLAAGADPDKYIPSYGDPTMVTHEFRDPALATAAGWGRDSTVSILIQHGADINRQNNKGWTALHRAAENGHNKVTTTLIEAGAELNIQTRNGSTPLILATNSGENKVVQTLIEAGADLNRQIYNGDTALILAAHKKQSEVLTALIKAGADPNIRNKKGETALNTTDEDGNTLMHRAAGKGDNREIRTLIEAGADLDIKNKKDQTALTIAAWYRQNTIVQSLIKAGADLNIQDNDGDTALHCSSLRRETEMVTALIKAGADLNIRNKEGETPLNTTDKDGNTLMHLAAEKGDNKEIRTLIEAGADLDIQNKKRDTPLTIATKKGENRVVQTLIEAGADLNIQDNDGDTALHCAVVTIQNEVITALTKAGADLTIRNNAGITALQSAGFKRQNEVLKTLIEAGADLKIQHNDAENALEKAAKGGHYDVVTTLIEAGTETSCLANMMINKEPSRISSVLDFLSKKLEKFEDLEDKRQDYFEKKKDYERTKTNLGIEVMKEKQKMMFYNVPCKDLDDKSLLEFIDSQNVRLSRQREELIDLSVKIADLNNRYETVETDMKAIDEVINHYKSGLPSGVGLRDMIKMIQDRYPWSSSKKIIMIFVSLVACILGIGLFVLDLTSDVQFSNMMFNITIENKILENEDETFNTAFTRFLSKNYNLTFPSHENCGCLKDLETEFAERKNSTLENINYDDYETTGWISLYHCVQPFLAILIVFLSMNCKGGKCSAPDEPEDLRNPWWWCCFSSVLCCCIPTLAYIGSVVPLPGLTNLYQFYLEVRSHHARSKSDFRDKIVSIEEEIRKHEALGKFLKSSENLFFEFYNLIFIILPFKPHHS